MVRKRFLHVLLRILDLLETITNRLFLLARIRLRRTQENTISPNNPNSWEKLYLSRVTPVNIIESEIALKIVSLTEEGELLLEAGCGSGRLSAEMALAGRRIAVCDFSHPILSRIKRLFEVSGLVELQTFHADLTKRLPFVDNQFDVVWSSGVLEHWTDEELQPIVTEFARCAKRCVISLVPNKLSLLYRYGRETAETLGISPWGREIPRSSLQQVFYGAGLTGITETTICLVDAPSLISLTDPVLSQKIAAWWNAISDDDPVKTNQGYLLLTVGYKK